MSRPDPAVLLVALVEYPLDQPEEARRYEDDVLALLEQHGGRLERRLRSTDGWTEVHLIRFASRAGWEAFRADPQRRALRAALGDAAPVGRVIEVRDI
ncbi:MULTISPECIES: hypothetical protein [unclassified Micromonospora]|uniref:hypothetical protein n=1 Tax=unclassified Micromonospora TaxID=2617518 RepID=UPI00104734B3|nr:MULTISPECIES: hypothetical protein [unclassified Micromonospora]TDB71366.1 hypothetical protein E1182_25275 [Micromonospora sp. KC721]TDC36163.1 hypothetical protein E1166_22610 [Micromonospora sp. KC213]